MQLEFGYGNGVQTVEPPQENLLGVLHASPIEHERRGPDAVSWALAHPIGSAPLHALARPGQRIAIVTSDITRPLPSYQILPGVLDELYRAGVRPEDITVVLALGSHRKHTPEEVIRLVGRECYETVRCVDSDAAGCIHLGDTAHGTPVDITRAVAEADFRICLGNIEFHYFAGYSGGAPKGANLYQTQKALDNAKHAVKDGGTIILIGACPEGLGSKTFSDWLLAALTAHSMVERTSRNFQLGGHKAAAIAMVLEKASIDLVSEMDDDFVRHIFLEPKPSAQAALDAAFRKYGPAATVLAMPHGGSTLPYLQDAGPDHSRT